MDQIPEGAIPVDQFQAADQPNQSQDTNQLVNQSQTNQIPEGAIPVDQFQTQDQAYGSTKQQIFTGLESAGRGLLGPLATGFETNTLGIPKEDILGRQKENPIISGIGEAAGLTTGMLTGTGEAAAMSKAGEMALDVVGMGGKLTEGASTGFKIGSSAVQQAAEMAVLQGSDEVSKMILNDPDASTQTAISNIGMSAALGGAAGAFITGAVSPLWKATVGPKVDELLNFVKNRVNGGSKLILPETLEQSLNTLGIKPDPVMRAGLSDDIKLQDMFGTLRRSESPTIDQGIENLNNDVSTSVMNSLGTTVEDVAKYDKSDAGHELLSTFTKEYDAKYNPVEQAMEQRNLEAAPIQIPDEARLDRYNKILEQGIFKVGTDSPYYIEYQNYGNRVLAKDTVGQLDTLKTEINNRIAGGGDRNTINALKDIKNSINDFQEQQILNIAKTKDTIRASLEHVKGLPRVTLPGQFESAIPAASDLINRRLEANRSYSEFANMSNQLTNHLGIGDFKGAGTLKSRLSNKISPEELYKKFTIKNNSEFTPFLQQYFPETFQKVLINERKEFIKSAILSAAKKGEVPIDVKKLSSLVSKSEAGQQKYIQSIFPQEALNKIEAGKNILNAIPNPKNSGTPAGLAKIFSSMSTSALAAIGWMTGHGPLASILVGETASRLGKDAPEAIKLAYLKFLGSEQPIKSEGFKAMVDLFHNTYKGNNLISKATTNTFKAGTQVLATNQMPAKEDKEKLDKLVTKYQANPEEFMAKQNSQVGYYLPQHQVSLSQASTQSLQYLQQLKPQVHQPGPLDARIDPSVIQKARYNRALDIAEQPMIVLQHIKDGTLQTSDLQDLKAMYPALYATVSQKLTNEMVATKSNENRIPYKTRLGLSLFLGQPLDSTMNPSSIQTAQSIYMPPQAPQQAQNQKKTKKGTSTLGKSNSSYTTPIQAADADKANRE